MEAIQVVDEQIAAFNARDVERFVRCYSPDAVIEDGLGNVMVTGHEAIRGLYGQLFAQSPDLHVEIPKRIQVGAFVIDEEQVTGFVFPGFPTELHSAVAYRVEGNAIVYSRLMM